jgi:antitoxin component YwqK of YwqJK toxin-antitoxin module
MKKNKNILFLLLFSLIPILTCACWPFKCQTNRYDSKGFRQGKWIVWWDEASKSPLSITHFKDDHERGKSRYFYMDGTRRMKFYTRKDGRVRVKYYTETGRLEKKGRALMIVTPEQVRYCWHGKWKFYENRKCVKVSVYNMGKQVAH